MPSPLLLLLGSGPGIGLSIATAFALKHFTRLALCARNAEHLARERKQIIAAAKAAGREVEVRTFVVDLGDLVGLKGRLEEIERVCAIGGDSGGELGCVWHNAASVRFSEPLSEGMELVEGDMKVSPHSHVEPEKRDIQQTDHITADERSFPLHRRPMVHPAPPRLLLIRASAILHRDLFASPRDASAAAAPPQHGQGLAAESRAGTA